MRPVSVACALSVGELHHVHPRAARDVEAFGQPEVQHFHRAVLADFDVRGLQVPMDDPLLVRGFEGVRDLRRDRERLVDGNRPADDPIGERRALDQLHHQGVYAVGVFEPVDLRDVRMIERREHPRFSPEAGEAIGIAGDGGQQDFDRDLAIERRVAGLVDLAHPARADSRRDLIRADALPLEAPCHPGVVAPHHRWRLEKALRALVRRQERLHFLAQRLVAVAGLGEVRWALDPPAAPARPRTRLSGAASRQGGGSRAVDSTPGARRKLERVQSGSSGRPFVHGARPLGCWRSNPARHRTCVDLACLMQRYPKEIALQVRLGEHVCRRDRALARSHYARSPGAWQSDDPGCSDPIPEEGRSGSDLPAGTGIASVFPRDGWYA